MFIYVLTPIVGASFPALAPLILAAGGALGYKVMVDMKEGGQLNTKLRQKLQETNTVNLRVDELIFDSMKEEVKRADSLYLEKGEIVLALIKDERDKLRIEVSGPDDYSKRQLEEEGRAFAEELAQMFAMNRVVEEVERMNAEVVEEEELENGEIQMKIRRWT